MASSGSSKDLTKALNGFFQAPSLPLPAELLAVITAYLDKHEKVDNAGSDRLNDELLTLYEKNVQGRPEKYASFLAILRQLRPAIRTPARIFEWWNRLLDPVLECVDREKGLASEVLDHTLDLLALDDNNEPATWNEAGLAPFINRLLTRWLEARDAQASARSPFAKLKERMIREALLIFGKKDPKGFLTALDGFAVKRDYRNNSFALLADFVTSQPPHLHLIMQTPLFVNILHSLQRDESTATMNAALLALVMLLPFVPNSLGPYLPTLFNIYARVLFWEGNSYFTQQHTEFGMENGNSSPGIAWEKSLLRPDQDGNTLHYIDAYFTILYGLYPINFVDYIRKPQRYLRHANNNEDIDVQAMEIRDRSERLSKKHRLHPNFYRLTIESEKTDLSRWIKSAADEVLTDCFALRIETPAELEAGRGAAPPPGAIASPSPMEETDSFDYPLLSSSTYVDSPLLGNPSSVGLAQQVTPPEAPGGGRESIRSGRRGSQSSHPSARESVETKPRDVGGDSPTLPPHLIQSPSHTHLQDLIHSNRLANDSVPSLALSPEEAAAEHNPLQISHPHPLRISRAAGGDASDETALLYHQSLLLLNDLQFERYIKQQHMTHMGELRRKQIREAATEAETQSLVIANRSLKQRLDDAKRQEGQIKKEFDHRRNMAQKRENDLSAKLRTLREEQKKWSAEGIALRQLLEAAQADCERLRRMVDEAEEKRLRSEQNLQAVDISMDEIVSLKAEIARLSAVEHEYQGKQLKMESATQGAAAAESRAEQWKMELAAREEQLQQARSHYETQLALLNGRLTKALKDGQSEQASKITAVWESALSASRAKQAELQKQYSTLMRKYTVLHSTLLEMRSESSERKGAGADGDAGGASSFGAADGESMVVPMPGSPIAIRNRANRGFSDPEAFEGISHNATSPLEPASSSLGSGGGHRPTTPLEAGDKMGTSTSPQMERYFGRGGVQNAIRKERKEPSKDDTKSEKKDKKDKKTGPGMRGLRNFV